ncbi:DUF1338 domain-containing protein [Bremerella alba]|uniref:2-oxoadipate dioxygenase/decarboxylase n=1 Tax=Bremerella alba TaxID=980252 RepID=A0A7V8V5G7_9BACT|nr:DUF1338 domain-containing protein [Bremerella alba]MBA2115308.1 hypothetical protein [Bremerella alba]
MTRSIEKLIDQLWDSYQKNNPQADRIHRLLSERGETIVNDHIAFRTFQDPRIGIDQLAIPFLEAGYQAGDDYRFDAKKLYARHFQHSDPALPKVFISELMLDEFSDDFRDIIQRMLDQIPNREVLAQPLCTAGRLWEVPYADYKALSEQSEYAAWMAAHGFCANHFTVFVNALTTIDSLQDLNALLLEEGFSLNQEGGAIKGSPEVYLEQSSTIASVVDVPFKDGDRSVPGCYYEFARRYTLPNGSLFGGFVAKSADKIFESTDKKLHE